MTQECVTKHGRESCRGSGVRLRVLLPTLRLLFPILASSTAHPTTLSTHTHTQHTHNTKTGKSQKQRLAALHAFKSEAVPLLLATDVASRGLDIPTVDLVVNYDLPRLAADYVHR